MQKTFVTLFNDLTLASNIKKVEWMWIIRSKTSIEIYMCDKIKLKRQKKNIWNKILSIKLFSNF